ncbi:hypothetical protein T439DRAFT_346494 [Meredithblackwellia eburnea MCA 4105]
MSTNEPGKRVNQHQNYENCNPPPYAPTTNTSSPASSRASIGNRIHQRAEVQQSQIGGNGAKGWSAGGWGKIDAPSPTPSVVPPAPTPRTVDTPGQRGQQVKDTANQENSHTSEASTSSLVSSTSEALSTSTVQQPKLPQEDDPPATIIELSALNSPVLDSTEEEKQLYKPQPSEPRMSSADYSVVDELRFTIRTLNTILSSKESMINTLETDRSELLNKSKAMKAEELTLKLRITFLETQAARISQQHEVQVAQQAATATAKLQKELELQRDRLAAQSQNHLEEILTKERTSSLIRTKELEDRIKELEDRNKELENEAGRSLRAHEQKIEEETTRASAGQQKQMETWELIEKQNSELQIRNQVLEIKVQDFAETQAQLFRAAEEQRAKLGVAAKEKAEIQSQLEMRIKELENQLLQKQMDHHASRSTMAALPGSESGGSGAASGTTVEEVEERWKKAFELEKARSEVKMTELEMTGGFWKKEAAKFKLQFLEACGGEIVRRSSRG